MGTISATLHSVEPNTTKVTATFSWGTSKRAIQPSPAPWSQVFSFSAVWAGFPLPGKSYSSSILKRLGATR